MTGAAIVLAAFCAFVAGAGDPELESAARAYREGRYAEALVRYERALDVPGAPRGAVLFNMGNCAYRLGRHADAVLLYRRAALRLPDDREVEFNRRLAERQLGIDADAQAADARSAPGAWSLLLVAALQGAGLLGLSRSRGRPGLRAGAAVLLLGGVVVAIGAVDAAWAPRTSLGVAIGASAPVRGEPHVDLPPVVELRAGETCRVEEMSDRWMRITHPRGAGWVERAAITLVD